MQGANFAIEKSAAPVAPQKPAERPAAVNMAWGFEGQENDEAPLEEAETRTGEARTAEARAADPESEGEGEGRRPRRRRRRGRRDDRGEQRGRGEQAKFASNGEADASQLDQTREDPERGPDEASTDATEGIPGVGEQPSGPFGDDEGEEKRGRRRRRGRRGGRRGRDRDAPRSGDEAAATNGNGSDLEPSDHVTGADEPHEPVSEPSHAVENEPMHAARDVQSGGNVEPRWSLPAGPGRSAAEPDVARDVDTPRPPAPPEERRRETAHAEQPAEEDDPSRPSRKGWWQRRFTGP
jgi:ribonuclease E